jgi:hypothetical protein
MAISLHRNNASRDAASAQGAMREPTEPKFDESGTERKLLMNNAIIEFGMRTVGE